MTLLNYVKEKVFNAGFLLLTEWYYCFYVTTAADQARKAHEREKKQNKTKTKPQPDPALFTLFTQRCIN